MSEFHVVHDKSRGNGFPVARWSVTMPEECDLVTKRSTICRFQVSGKIPPFGAELVVRKMISRKGYLITGHSDGPSLIVHIFGQNRCHDQEHGKTAAYNSIHASILMESIIFPREA